MKKTMTALAVAVVAGAASAQPITFDLVQTVDFAGQALGGNIGSVAWDGQNLYAGGFNNTGSTADVSIVSWNTSTGFGSAFGTISATAATGHEYMSIDNINDSGQVFSSDTANNQVLFFDGPTGTQYAAVPAASANNTDGVAFDRRFGGRVAHVLFGRGLLFRDNPDGTAAGDVGIFNGGLGTAFRGIDVGFNGDLLVRAANGTVRYATGDGTSASGVYDAGSLISLGPGATQQGLNIQALDDAGTGFGDFAIFNYRGNGALEDQLLVTDFDGNVIAFDFDLNGQSLLDGNGWYSFSYDVGTNTLAVGDFLNNQVYIFSVVPAPGAAAMLGMCGMIASRRRR